MFSNLTQVTHNKPNTRNLPYDNLKTWNSIYSFFLRQPRWFLWNDTNYNPKKTIILQIITRSNSNQSHAI